VNRFWRSALQVSFLLGFILLLVRFFPYVAIIAEGAALGIREFWWAILILALSGWLIWVLRSRNPG
jgi:hypothetical protein